MFSVIHVVSMPISFFHNRFNIVAKLLCIVQLGMAAVTLIILFRVYSCLYCLLPHTASVINITNTQQQIIRYYLIMFCYFHVIISYLFYNIQIYQIICRNLCAYHEFYYILYRFYRYIDILFSSESFYIHTCF